MLSELKEGRINKDDYLERVVNNLDKFKSCFSGVDNTGSILQVFQDLKKDYKIYLG